jgi:hypothetical protein
MAKGQRGFPVQVHERFDFRIGVSPEPETGRKIREDQEKGRAVGFYRNQL